MSPTPSLSSVRKALLRDGMVAILVDPAAADAALTLTANGLSVPFRICPPVEAGHVERLPSWRPDLSRLVQDTGSTPPETAPGERFACWVNHLSDWTLTDHPTVQLMIARPDAPAVVRLGSPIRIAFSPEGLAFRAWLGVHRGLADLVLTVRGAEGRVLAEHRVAFGAAHRGGQDLSGYQAVELALPASATPIEVGLAVDYRAHVPDGLGSEPFFFIADPRASTAEAEAAVLRPIVLDLGTGGDGVWMSAALPAELAAGDRLDLCLGAERRTLFTGAGTRLTRTADLGQDQVWAAMPAGEVVLCVDGTPLRRVMLTEAGTPLRLPAEVMDGQAHALSLKDHSGTQTLAEDVRLLPPLTTPAERLRDRSRAPWRGDLDPAAAGRYRSLRAHVLDGRPDAELRAVAQALDTLDTGVADTVLRPIRIALPDDPLVSVVIPAHGKVAFTYRTLCALIAAWNRASFEVIVVDDASDDETARLETIVEGIRVVRFDTPQRFIRACNAGVAASRGQYVVLLNNDTEVTDRWLDELVDAFARFPRIGLAGSKLVYPDGRLQDAGGIVWRNGNPWNYGNRGNPFDPRFSYARRADYLSGAALMTTRAIWDEVGGLSDYLEPMYFEDTDLSFKIREAGYSTWFVPTSVVVHHEGATSGTDVTRGFKRFQEINRPRFKHRWSARFAGFGKEGHLPDLEKDRGATARVLVIDHDTPRPDRDAGSHAAIQEMALMRSLGIKVTFLPVDMAHGGAYTTDLQRSGVEVIHAPFHPSANAFIAARIGEFDAVYVTRYYAAAQVLDAIRRFAPGIKVLFNNADLHFLRELRAAMNDPARLDRARQIREDELAVIRRVDLVLSYNEAEHPVIQSHTDARVPVLTCPWVVRAPDRVPGIAGRRGMSFLGNFGHHPNAEGVGWFVRTVLPRLGEGAHMPLHVYGANMGPDIRALERPGVRVIGHVERTAEAYDPHLIFVAPLLSGAGIKGKVIDAMAHAIPCVLSPLAAEGIGVRDGHDCLVCASPDDWVRAIDRLAQDPDLAARLATNARDYVLDRYSFARGRDMMRAAFEAVDVYLGEAGGP